MKSFILAAAFLFTSSSAFARPATISQLRTAVNQISHILQDGGEAESKAGNCKFTITPGKDGFGLKLETEKLGTIELTVPNLSNINLIVKQTSEDGSYDEVFDIGGIGTVEVIHADDAYDEVTLANTSTHHTCGAYY
jgi:hypothetical protein